MLAMCVLNMGQNSILTRIEQTLMHVHGEVEIGSSLEASERQRVYSGICLRRSWRVIFKMLYTEIESLSRKKHKDNNMEKH